MSSEVNILLVGVQHGESIWEEIWLSYEPENMLTLGISSCTLKQKAECVLAWEMGIYINPSAFEVAEWSSGSQANGRLRQQPACSFGFP